MSTIEEGTPLVAVEPSVATPVSYKRPFAIAVALATLATTLCVAFLGTSNKPSAGFLGANGVNLGNTMNLAVEPMMLKDSRSYKMKFSSTTNKAAEASIIQRTFGPFDYLSGLSTSLPMYPLLQPTQSKWSIKIDFFEGVHKVSYTKKGDIEKSVHFGHMTGLDKEANIVALNGDYCEAGNGPYHTTVPIICGREFEIREFESKSACWHVIKVAHPRQCKNTVKTVGTWPEKLDADARVDAVYATA